MKLHSASFFDDRVAAEILSEFYESKAPILVIEEYLNYAIEQRKLYHDPSRSIELSLIIIDAYLNGSMRYEEDEEFTDWLTRYSYTRSDFEHLLPIIPDITKKLLSKRSQLYRWYKKTDYFPDWKKRIEELQQRLNPNIAEI